jgi:antitoxin (DNA-binding transcriptional repressor) of toxin-antitoxin stability system
MLEYSVEEAQVRFSELISRAEGGERIAIRRGEQVVILRGLTEAPAKKRRSPLPRP